MLLRLITALVLGTASMTTMADDHAHSHQMNNGRPIITQVWSRAMPPSAPTGAVYFTLSNPGDTPDRLMNVQTPRAEKAELHTHVHKGDVMSMERIDSVEVPAGGEVEFKPGSSHVMLFKLSEPLVAGEHFPLTLTFENAGEVTVDVAIQEQAPESNGNAHQHH